MGIAQVFVGKRQANRIRRKLPYPVCSLQKGALDESVRYVAAVSSRIASSHEALLRHKLNGRQICTIVENLDASGTGAVSDSRLDYPCLFIERVEISCGKLR